MHIHTRGHTHPCNVASSGTDAADCHTNPTSRFGDEGTLLQCVIDALNAVVLHGQKEAARKRKFDGTYCAILFHDNK